MIDSDKKNIKLYVYNGEFDKDLKYGHTYSIYQCVNHGWVYAENGVSKYFSREGYIQRNFITLQRWRDKQIELLK